MESVIYLITPVESKVGLATEAIIRGNNFIVDSTNPSVTIDGKQLTIVTCSNTEIKVKIPKSLPMGIYEIEVLNLFEQQP